MTKDHLILALMLQVSALCVIVEWQFRRWLRRGKMFDEDR